MGYIKFENLDEKYFGMKVKQFRTQSGEKGVELIFPDDAPEVNLSGFKYFTDTDVMSGDYTDMITVYRQDYDVNGYMLSSDGTTYVEPTTYTPEPIPQPEPYVPTETELRIAELNAIIEQNKALLAETDYKVIKNSEYAEAGLSAAYDPTEVNAERQTYRDAINAAETELATLTGGVSDAS